MATPIPAPWDLRGTGFILLYHPPAGGPWSHLGADGPAPHRGPAAVLLVDYRSSPAGPYRELLFIPGRFRFGGCAGYSITRIFVNTEESLLGGRDNWGIPKERAAIELRAAGRRTAEFRATAGGTPILQAAVTRRAFSPPLPFVVAGLRLLQRREGRLYCTRFGGSGWLRPAKLESMEVNSGLFPDLGGRRPFAALQAQRFRLRFEAAETHPPASAGAGSAET